MDNFQTPSNSNSRPSFCAADDEDFNRSFGNLGLGNQDGSFGGNQASSSSNHYGAFSPTSYVPPQTQFPTWSMNESSQLYDHNVSADYSSGYGGETLYSNQLSMPSFVDSEIWANNYLDYEYMRRNSGSSLMPTLSSQLQTEAMLGWYNNQGYSSRGFSPIRNNGLSLGNEYFQNINGILESSISLQNEHRGNYGEPVSQYSVEGKNIMAMAMEKSGSLYLQRALQEANPKNINIILAGVLDHIPELMTDQYGHHMFLKLVESSNSYDLHRILNQLYLQSELLIKAACDILGSNSIQKLVKKLKKSELGSCLTAILSPRIVDLATDKKARHVLKECLSLLSNEANKVLYEEAIKHFDILATHEVGCLALNDCIDYISESEQRDKLLQLVVDKSIFLAHDPSGNFVLQHTIALANPTYTFQICDKLRGHYIQLSTKKFGSHVVEKCIKYCRKGSNHAVVEILEKGKALELARHQYGNYVIQKALEKTQIEDIGLCQSLINALLSGLPGLVNCRTSKKVLEKIKALRDLYFSSLKEIPLRG